MANISRIVLHCTAQANQIQCQTYKLYSYSVGQRVVQHCQQTSIWTWDYQFTIPYHVVRGGNRHYPIPLYHGREWTDWNCTKVSHFLCPVSTVHLIPFYYGKEWTDWDRTKVSHLLHAVLTVHPIQLYDGRMDWVSFKVSNLLHSVPLSIPPFLPWEGMDRLGLYQMSVHFIRESVDSLCRDGATSAICAILNPLYPNDDYSCHEYRYVNSE